MYSLLLMYWGIGRNLTFPFLYCKLILDISDGIRYYAEYAMCRKIGKRIKEDIPDYLWGAF